MSIDQSPGEEYREIAGRFTRLVEAVPDEHTWARPAPPEGWNARDVVRHLLTWFPGLLHDGAGITLPVGPAIDDDPVGAWRIFSDGVQAVLDDPANDGRGFSHPQIGELPMTTAVSRYFTADVFLHTWDLARATGQDETLDPQRCAAMLEGMRPLDEVLRASGHYGPRVAVEDDADAQTKLLAFIGRDPQAT